MISMTLAELERRRKKREKGMKKKEKEDLFFSPFSFHPMIGEREKEREKEAEEEKIAPRQFLFELFMMMIM